jgi:uncharacterized SAM-binding protein YcdF (DUF218 family)
MIERYDEGHDTYSIMKTCPYYNLRRGLFWGILIAGSFGVLLILLLQNLGRFLIVKTELPDAVVPTMIVLSGGSDRIEYATEMFLEGVSEQLMISGGVFYGARSNASSLAEYVVAQGVSEENIILEHEASNTLENALYTKKLFQNTPESIMLVTSDYHQKRAFLTFRYVYPETMIYNASAPSSDWNADEWWTTKKSIYLTITETIKIWWGQLTGVWG